MTELKNSLERKIIERQKRLSELLGVSGHEQNVVNAIIDEIKPVVDKYWIDSTGNLLAVIQGPPDRPAILLDAHTDEIGFIITHITEKGFAYFTLIGGWDERLLLGQNIIVEPQGERIFGVIGALPPHILTSEERKKIINIEKLFIDFGFNSREEAEKGGVTIGTVGTLYSGFQELPGGCLKGKAFDDRTGCNVLIQTALNVRDKDLPFTICFSWASQEEVGARGAKTSAYSFAKDYNIEKAVAIESTTAADVPGVASQKNPSILGKGPAITLMDASMIASPKIRALIVKVAEINKIPYQYKIPASGGTDAGTIHLTLSGISTGVISVPSRYIHSPNTIIDTRDLINVIKLVTAFILYNP